MCGIFGAVNLSGFFDTEDFNRFVSLTDMVHYRGPDASGYLGINLKEKVVAQQSKFDVFLGHRRLSIIDLSENANQPLTDDLGLWLIYNGEIFNYVELRDELIRDGCTFKTNSDTEVILAVYRKYSETGFDRLNGMWAFVLVDIERKKIVLSRDRFSIKPLYYVEINHCIYFASEIKQIQPLLKSKEMNPNIMFTFLEQGLLDHCEETFFKNVYKVKPKQNLVIDVGKGTLEYREYWDYSFNGETAALSEEEMAEKFRELLDDSVKIRLRSDVRIGALLSGGLDSSSVVAIANRLQKSELPTYSVVSRADGYCEEKYIDLFLKSQNSHNFKMKFKCDTNETFLNDLNTVLYHNDEPVGGFSIIAQCKIFEALKANSDIVVVLSGQGGDEVLMGYLKYFFFNIKRLIRAGSFLTAFRELLSSILSRTAVWQFSLGGARRYMPFLIQRTPKAFVQVHNELEKMWVALDLRERQILDIDRYSIPALAHYEDRNSMAHSLEVRHPFLDHRLVNFALNLPVSSKLNRGWTKYILRRSMTELPRGIRWRRDKQGFLIPEELWLKKDFSGMIRVMFSKSILGSMGVIDEKLFLQYYRRFVEGEKWIHYADISRVLIAECWARNNWGGGAPES